MTFSLVFRLQDRLRFSPQLIHALSQPAVSNPCDRLRCSHLCLLAPATRAWSGALSGAEPTAVCRCPKGMLLSKDKLTCSLPAESSFVLLLSDKTIHQVTGLTACQRRQTQMLLSRSSRFIPPSSCL